MTRCSRFALRLGLACLLVAAGSAPFSRFGPCGPGNDAGALMLIVVPLGGAITLLGGLLRLPSFALRHQRDPDQVARHLPDPTRE